MSHRSRRRGAGSLRLRLLSLVLLPLLGLVTYAVGALHRGMQLTDAAGHVRDSVELVAALSGARGAVAQELLPSFSRVLTGDEAGLRAFGLDDTGRRALAATSSADVRTTRATTDLMLTHLAGRQTPADLVSTIRRTLGGLREQTDLGGGGYGYLYYGYGQVGQILASAEAAAMAGAVKEGIDPDGVLAVRDMHSISDLLRASNAELPYYLGARLPVGGDSRDNRRAWIDALTAYLRLRAEVARMGTPVIHDAWAAAALHPAMISFDRTMQETLDEGLNTSTFSLSLGQILTLTDQSKKRDGLLTTVLTRSVERVVHLADEREREITRSLRWQLTLTLSLVLADLLLVWLVGRWLTGPLRRLAHDARQISEGSLVEVTQSGPQEVRTVAHALAAAVASLQRLRLQADTVVRGDLDDPIVMEPLPGPLGQAMHSTIEAIILSIRTQRDLQSDLAHQAAHDALTELPNRAQGLRMIGAALARAHPSGAQVGLLFIDLDHFKVVNDTYGHAAGDRVLRTVAGRLQSLTRTGDMVCRLGGDEFVLLMEPVVTPAALVEVAERITDALSLPIDLPGRSVTIGASVGIAVSSSVHGDAGSLLHEADVAAYRAKAAGRGRVEVFDDALRAELAEQGSLEEAILVALAQDEFTLHFQPVVEVGSGELHGFEALIRWHRPGHGMVAPNDFIPAAERSTLICDIGRWTLNRATAQLAGWLDSCSGGRESDVSVAVNIAGRHLSSTQIVDDVVAALDSAGLDGRHLVIELTETMIVDDPTATDRLQALRALGVSVAIDDFGTGYTSIGHLQRLPVDVVKIDRSFVNSETPGHQELVKLIIAAAHTFSLAVVAEGVEEDHQLQTLRELDCDLAQGYLVSRPVPMDAIPARPLGLAVVQAV